MKRKVIKKQNKRKINNILSKCWYRHYISNKKFMSGYFIFAHEPNSICHFKIDCLPEWKFGIWLNEDGEYQVFGEHELMIDKFKPTSTIISETDIDNFSAEFSMLLYAEYIDIPHLKMETRYGEYMKSIENEKMRISKCNVLNTLIYNKVSKLISTDKYNNKNYNINIHDSYYGSPFRSTPRYEFHLMVEDSYKMTQDAINAVYEMLRVDYNELLSSIDKTAVIDGEVENLNYDMFEWWD